MLKILTNKLELRSRIEIFFNFGTESGAQPGLDTQGRADQSLQGRAHLRSHHMNRRQFSSQTPIICVENGPKCQINIMNRESTF